MPETEVPASPEAKLERVIAAYLVAHCLAALSLTAAQIYCGQDSPTIDDETPDRLIVEAGMGGGPNADQGNYETPLAFWIVTRAKDQPSDHRAGAARHHARLTALAGLFTEAGKEDLCAALAALDPGLGISSYWGYDREEHSRGELLVVCIRKTFETFLA